MEFSQLKNYQYDLPSELIRKKPLEPRDSARLFVYDTKADTVTLDTFRNLAEYLPEESLLVLNNSRVLPARLSTAISRKNSSVTKSSIGGKLLECMSWRAACD
ncbi:MAG: S-adenosylmethionine:tRNA ribosyltransferase-isomerase [Candidatus Moraniibacteriota bacterium]